MISRIDLGKMPPTVATTPDGRYACPADQADVPVVDLARNASGGTIPFSRRPQMDRLQTGRTPGRHHDHPGEPRGHLRTRDDA